MTTSDMLETFTEIACKAYKKNSRGCLEARKLDRKESVEIEHHVFSCWREYVIYKMGEYVQGVLPNADVKVILNGNKSSLDVGCDDNEQQKLNTSMYSFLKSIGGI